MIARDCRDGNKVTRCSDTLTADRDAARVAATMHVVLAVGSILPSLSPNLGSSRLFLTEPTEPSRPNLGSMSARTEPTLLNNRDRITFCCFSRALIIANVEFHLVSTSTIGFTNVS